MYFADLTRYEYGAEVPTGNVLNVGWLDHQYEFERGACDEEFVGRLELLVASPVNLYRGVHLCPFCPDPPTKFSKGGIPMLDPRPGTTGNGEIRVRGIDGNTYVAPALILHYIRVHGYRPPSVFIDAVLSASDDA